jgi:hypothetical protein
MTESPGTSSATFWTALGSLAAVASVVVAVMALDSDNGGGGGGGEGSYTPPSSSTVVPADPGEDEQVQVEVPRSGGTSSTGGTGSTGSPSFAATVLVPAGLEMYVHSSPALDAQVVASVPSGDTVHILCTVQGERVDRPDGPSSRLWDRIEEGYVPDVVLDTGTSEPTMRDCSG